jgi:hypothetical protein
VGRRGRAFVGRSLENNRAFSPIVFIAAHRFFAQDVELWLEQIYPLNVF